MPLPNPGEKESKDDFVSRCMGDSKMAEEYPDNKQRYAVCVRQASANVMDAAASFYEFDMYGYTEEVTEATFVVPKRTDYVDINNTEDLVFNDWDIAEERPGLWENIRKKKQREGKDYKPAKPGDKDRPDPEAWKKAQSLWKETIAEYDEGQMQREQLMKMHHQLMEIEEYLSGVKFEDWTKDMISKSEIYIQNIYDFVEARKSPQAYAAEYQGRKVTLNKPFRTPDGPKKFAVYTKNEKGNIVKVNFGSPDMEIKRDDPERRKSFRARHKCDQPGPKYKAKYWSCRNW